MAFKHIREGRASHQARSMKWWIWRHL